jgi:site-specific recombinase XerD
VAAYIETLQRQAAPPTVKQHMAAIRMLFSWLAEKGELAMNPAREVKTERFSRTEGKTPAFVEGEIQKLLGTIETSTHTGLRDRSCLFRRVPGFHGGCRCTRPSGSLDETLR